MTAGGPLKGPADSVRSEAGWLERAAVTGRALGPASDRREFLDYGIVLTAVRSSWMCAAFDAV